MALRIFPLFQSLAYFARLAFFGRLERKNNAIFIKSNYCFTTLCLIGNLFGFKVIYISSICSSIIKKLIILLS